MTLSAQEIKNNWLKFTTTIEEYISSPRKEKLLEFYKKYEDRIIMMPAAHKKEYHGAFPGGYVDHVNRVVKAALDLNELWGTFGADTTTYTKEELIFSDENVYVPGISLTQKNRDTNEVYLSYSSPKTPSRVYKYNLLNKSKELVKEQEIPSRSEERRVGKECER